MSSCKFVIFSDIHHGPADIGVNFAGVKRKLTQHAVALTQKLISEINKIKPDVAINLGDLIEDLNDHDKDVSNLKHIWSVLQKIESPFYSVTGNHDLKAIPRKKVSEIMGYDHSSFSVDINGYHFVFLGLDKQENADLEKGTIKIRSLSEDDLKWLSSDLNKNKLPSLIFLHHGVAEDDMIGNWWFEKKKDAALLQNRDALKTILKKDGNLIAVFSGHQHWTKTIIEDGIKYYLVGSLTEDIYSNEKPDGIWLEISLQGKNIDVKEHHLEL